MKDQIIMQIVNSMSSTLTNEQLDDLKAAVYIALSPFTIEEKDHLPDAINPNWGHSLKNFLFTKAFEGKSAETIKHYRYELSKLLSYLNKNICDISSEDIFNYLTTYKSCRAASNQYLENKRLVYSSYFSWVHDHGEILSNPMRNISRFKVEQKIKQPFSDEERELLLIHANTIRDMAIMEFLYSTCVRVSELSALNIDDIRMNEKEVVVYGKGAKERIVYINSRAFIYLSMYLKSRTDNNPALFVSLNNPHKRLTKSGIETMIRETGRRAGINKAHPHRFRRTGATNARNRGMPIEEVATLLGHSKLETTRRYCTVEQQSVKFHHGQYLSA